MKIPVTPLGKPRMTQMDKWKKRPVVLKYHAFKDDLRDHITDLPEVLTITFHLPMPKSWSKIKQKEFEGAPHKSRPDLDNLLKAIMDAVLMEDSHIHTFKDCKKVWAYEGSIEIEN